MWPVASLYMQVSPLANGANQSLWGLNICPSQIKIQKIIKHVELLDLDQIWGIQQPGRVLVFLALIHSHLLSVTFWYIMTTVSFSDFSPVDRIVHCQFCLRISILFLLPSQKKGFYLCLPMLKVMYSLSPLWRVDMLIADSDLAVAGFELGEPASKIHICVTLVKLHKTLCIPTSPCVKLS